MKILKLKLLRDNARIPSRGTSGSAGYDIYASINEAIVLSPNEYALIPSGFSMALDEGYAAFIYARSGLGVKHGIVPRNCVGVVDSDYRGEVKIGLVNNSESEFTVNPLDRIAQMVICKCEFPEIETAAELDSTQRAAGGFGSTNIADK